MACGILKLLIISDVILFLRWTKMPSSRIWPTLSLCDHVFEYILINANENNSEEETIIIIKKELTCIAKTRLFFSLNTVVHGGLKMGKHILEGNRLRIVWALIKVKIVQWLRHASNLVYHTKHGLFHFILNSQIQPNEEGTHFHNGQYNWWHETAIWQFPFYRVSSIFYCCGHFSVSTTYLIVLL